MRFFSFFILAYIMLGLQLGLGGFMRIHGVEPNLMLLVVVFVALNAPRDEALIGALMLGAMQDLVTLQPLGLYALAYGLVAMVLVPVAPGVEHDHPLTHLAAAAVGGVVAAIVLLIHERIRPAGPAITEAGTALAAVRVSAGAILSSVVYTAAVAPLMLGVLQRMQSVFQLDSRRRKLRN